MSVPHMFYCGRHCSLCLCFLFNICYKFNGKKILNPIKFMAWVMSFFFKVEYKFKKKNLKPIDFMVRVTNLTS
jgi:hypothetical protein